MSNDKTGMGRTAESDKKALNSLEDFGRDIARQISMQESPTFEMPSRTLNNTFFNDEKKYLARGKTKSNRKYLNTAHTKKFMQSMVVAAACKKYIETNRSVEKREMYYNLKSHPLLRENVWNDDSESSAVASDLEASLNIVRTQLHLQAMQKGSVYGNVTLNSAGDDIDCSKLGRGGWTIPGYVEDVVINDYKDAEFILAIETNAMFTRLIEEKFAKRLGCIMVTGQGMMPTGVRRFLRVLQDQTNLPVYGFTDGDPWGFYIYLVMKYGSIAQSQFSKYYAVPNSKYIGMTMDDVDTYSLKKVTEPLKQVDYKKIKDLLKLPWIKQHKEWIRQIKLMEERKIRIEQQALSNKALDFVANTYLPEKIENQIFLP